VQLSKPEHLEGGGLRFMITPVNCLDATVAVSGELQGFKASQPLPGVQLDGQARAARTDACRDGLSQAALRDYVSVAAGPSGATHDPSAIYRLPYPPERRWVVSQGNFGRFSHEAGSGDEYCVDWAMPSGSPVCAARGGIVIAIKQDSEIGGRTAVSTAMPIIS